MDLIHHAVHKGNDDNGLYKSIKILQLNMLNFVMEGEIEIDLGKHGWHPKGRRTTLSFLLLIFSSFPSKKRTDLQLIYDSGSFSC